MPPWGARARLTTGRGGVTHIGSLRDCIDHWLALENGQERAVITCDIALRVTGATVPVKRLEAPDIASLAKRLSAAGAAAE